jgi:Protein of unknown function (DUF2939)
MGKQWKAMSWTLLIAAVLAVLLLAYAIWPVVGFARIASAIEARDGAALAKLVDFHALRKSLTKQIVAAYIERLADMVGFRIRARRLLRLSPARQSVGQAVQGETQPERNAVEARRDRSAPTHAG